MASASTSLQGSGFDRRIWCPIACSLLIWVRVAGLEYGSQAERSRPQTGRRNHYDKSQSPAPRMSLGGPTARQNYVTNPEPHRRRPLASGVAIGGTMPLARPKRLQRHGERWRAFFAPSCSIAREAGTHRVDPALRAAWSAACPGRVARRSLNNFRRRRDHVEQ